MLPRVVVMNARAATGGVSYGILITAQGRWARGLPTHHTQHVFPPRCPGSVLVSDLLYGMWYWKGGTQVLMTYWWANTMMMFMIWYYGYVQVGGTGMVMYYISDYMAYITGSTVQVMMCWYVVL